MEERAFFLESTGYKTARKWIRDAAKKGTPSRKISTTINVASDAHDVLVLNMTFGRRLGS